MADDIEQQVSTLRARAETRRAEQQKLEAQAEAAQADYERQREKLKADFGIDTVEEAEALLDRIDAELAVEIEQVRTELERTERPEE